MHSSVPLQMADSKKRACSMPTFKTPFFSQYKAALVLCPRFRCTGLLAIWSGLPNVWDISAITV